MSSGELYQGNGMPTMHAPKNTGFISTSANSSANFIQESDIGEIEYQHIVSAQIPQNTDLFFQILDRFSDVSTYFLICHNPSFRLPFLRMFRHGVEACRAEAKADQERRWSGF